MAQRLLISVDRWYREASGGARKLAGRWAEWLAENSFEVDLVAGVDPSAPSPTSPHPRLRLHLYPLPSAPSPSLRNLREHRARTTDLVAPLRAQGDYALHHGHIPLNFLGAADALRGSACRQLFTVHSPYAHELRAQWEVTGLTWKRRLALALARHLEAEVLRRAHRVHVLSDYTRSLLPTPRGKPADFFQKLPGAIEAPALCADIGDKGDIGGDFGHRTWIDGRPAFLTVRRLEARMGLENLLHAAATLRAENRAFALFIAGSGSRRAELEALRDRLGLANSVQILGFVPDADLERLYQSVLAALLPSTGLECFGLTILEAHLRGVPLLATPVGAIPETIGTENQAWLTTDASPEALADGLRACLDGKLTADPTRLQARAEKFLERAVFPRWAAAFGLT